MIEHTDSFHGLPSFSLQEGAHRQSCQATLLEVEGVGEAEGGGAAAAALAAGGGQAEEEGGASSCLLAKVS